MFKTEKQLVNKITRSIRNSKQSNLVESDFPLYIHKELNLGYGVADIVLTQFNNGKYRKRKRLDYFDISILKVIECEQEITIDKLFELTKSSRVRIMNSLKILNEENFVERDDALYRIMNKYQSILKNSIAIEAKLKDWKRGLKQAYRYNWFSNKSFVFLPNENINQAKNNINLFHKLNVGLASIDKNGRINIEFNPKRSQPLSEKMSFLLNEQVLQSLFKKRIPC